ARSPDGEPIATLMLITSAGRVVELLGASTPEGLRGRANYLLKWEAIRTSRLRGHHSYDMWGVEGGRWAEFKAGFGGEEVAYIGPWELVTDPVGRAVWQAAHAVRSATLRLRSRTRRRTSG
ncbi:MAG: peptidoglycan bridge formation glycyltransferase FemA/FemB family protein, partial [Chloroflexi bacterium]|nr:peptidoglycan bridge formation glycyltransferase FemA/FemB family protein [Chloroflexota bacterium]